MGPLTLHGGVGNPQRLRRLLDAETAEVTHLYDTGLAWIQRFQARQELVHRVHVLHDVGSHGIVGAPVGTSSLGASDAISPHGSRRERKELRSLLPVDGWRR